MLSGMLSGMLSSASRRSRAVAAVAGGAVAAAMSSALLLGAASPARADSVRDAEQWVLDAVNAPAAWPVSRGAGVTVAVIDSGVNGDVPDLENSVRSGPDLTGVHTPPDNPAWGMHGTWMASLIAGHGHDGGGSGIIGVAPLSQILSIRVITDKLDPGFAAYERQPLSTGQQELAEAITYAVDHGAGVISMSLGYGAPSRQVRVALQDAYARNVVVVASSGNSGDAAEAAGQGSSPYSFPANYLGVLGVGAVGQAWQPAAFSSDNLSVEVAAPGVNVPAEGRDAQYWLVSGTSPACALTAGVAALIKSRYPGLSAADVRNAIITSTWHRPPGGYDQQVGSGTVDAAAALVAAGRLAGRGQPSHTVAQTDHFGGGPQAVPSPPVRPRGALALLLYCLLAAGCLAVVGIATHRLVARRPSVTAGGSGPSGPPPTPGWGLLDAGEDDIDPGPAPGDEPPRDLPDRDLPERDLPERDLPERDLQSGSARFPWQSSSVGRHAAPSDRWGGPDGPR